VVLKPRHNFNLKNDTNIFCGLFNDTYTKINTVALVREGTIPTERPPLVGEVVPTFAERECRVVGATDSHGR
jgi:hypothetical protein